MSTKKRTIGLIFGVGALCLVALIGARMQKKTERVPIVEEENNVNKAVEKVNEVPVLKEELEPKQLMSSKWKAILRIAGIVVLVGIIVLGVRWKIKKEMSLFRQGHTMPPSDKESSQTDISSEGYAEDDEEYGYEIGSISGADDANNVSLLNKLNSANIGRSGNGQNAANVEELLNSARDGDLESLKVALGTVDINATDLGGQTALMAAAKASKENCVTYLLQQHANIDTKDEGGYTAMYFASQCKDNKCHGLIYNAKHFGYYGVPL